MQNNIKEVLNLCINYPSGDNEQPFDIKITENNTARISLRPDTLKHVYNAENMSDYISLGALLESIIIAASAHNLKARYRLDIPTVSAIVEFEKVDQLPASKLKDHLLSRHTNRFPFSKKAIEPQHLSEITNSIADIENVQISTNITPSKDFKNALAFGETIMFQWGQALKDVLKGIRFSKKEINDTENGLNYKGLGIDLPVIYFLRALRANLWLLTLTVKSKFYFIVSLITKINLKKSGGFIAFSITKTTNENLVNTGRALQRVWLLCDYYKIMAQPQSALILTLLTHEFNTSAYKPIPQALLDKILKYSKVLKKELQVEDRHISFLLKVGYGESISEAQISKKRGFSL